MLKKVVIFILCLSILRLNAQIKLSPEEKARRDSLNVSQKLEEVEVTAQRQNKAITGLFSGKTTLQLNELNALPRFLGETDALRTMQLMPGVQTPGEANSSINIRGSESSHNMVLLNGAPIYNAMHMLGFFSVFNSNHMSTFSMYRSHLSADKGGRLSSLLDMRTRDSLVTRLSGNINVGIISSQITLAIPAGKKSSFYISGRKTYLNLFMKPIMKKISEFSLGYDFQDYNATYIYAPSSKDKVTVNLYWGEDLFTNEEQQYQTDATIKWYNIAASANWDHRLDNNSIMKHTIYLSRFKNTISVTQNQMKAQMPSDITDIGYKPSFLFSLPRFNIQAGGEYIYHKIHPQYLYTDGLYGIKQNREISLYSLHEGSVFINGNFTINQFFILDIGLRFSGALQNGPYHETTYDEAGNLINTEHYKNGETVRYYGGTEPRISLNYAPITNCKFMISYNLTRQYMSQVSVSSLGFPTDFWMPASKRIPPQSAHSFSGGYYQSLHKNRYELSAELYYKKLSNQMEFDGEFFDMLNQRYVIEDRILYGSGNNYGTEFMLKKNNGKITGWVSYSLGWAYRRFPGINNGKKFPASHDRRHDLSIVVRYKINNRWDCSAVFVYATGKAITMPTAMYVIGENAVKEYGPHNGSRMPDYHRIDLSANYILSKNKHRESALNFSIYNAYARKNPVFLSVNIKENKAQNRLIIRKRGKSLFQLLPSISYSYKF